MVEKKIILGLVFLFIASNCLASLISVKYFFRKSGLDELRQFTVLKVNYTNDVSFCMKRYVDGVEASSIQIGAWTGPLYDSEKVVMRKCYNIFSGEARKKLNEMILQSRRKEFSDSFVGLNCGNKIKN